MHAEEAKFLAVWGRRRIGKTYLIEEFFKNKATIFTKVVGIKNGKLTKQLELFRLGLQKSFYGGATLPAFNNWVEAFNQLIAALKSLKFNETDSVVVFLDELPWLTTPKSGLLEALGNAWNTELKNFSYLKLVICGSAASWMLQKVILNKGGLHNRINAKINLKPFTLKETEEFLIYKGINLSRMQILELYLAIGGVPFYLNLVQKSESSEQAIARLCFGSGSLRNEYKELLESLFDNSKEHKLIWLLIETMVAFFCVK